MISLSSPLCDNHPRVNNALRASGPQAIMDIFGWLSHNGELQLIINLLLFIGHLFFLYFVGYGQYTN